MSPKAWGGGAVKDSPVNPHESAGSTSSSLLARVQGHDQRAWERLVNLYTPLVYRWCRQVGLQAADAADVGQEVFRAVARKIRDFHHGGKGDTFRGWLRTITQTKLVDLTRSFRAEGRGAGGDQDWLAQVPAEGSASSQDSQQEEETRLLIRRALELVRGEFEERTWQAFWRVAVEDQRPQDV